MKWISFIKVTIIAFSFFSCKETLDVYLGVPLQPDITENNYEPGLNIIGILRPDFTDTINRSFVHAQEVAPAINNYPEFTPDSMIIKTADIAISNTSGNVYEFEYTQYDNLFDEFQYRPTSDFRPHAGESYFISCSYSDLPVLTSSTIIPNEPKVIEGSIFLENDKIRLELEADTSIFLFEIYSFAQDKNTGFTRVVSNRFTATPLEITISEPQPDRIVIYGYDYNLTSYVLNSNTSLNFNKYRQPFGNVENGYGVFGSLNYILYSLE
jgi:hypothetical protein